MEININIKPVDTCDRAMIVSACVYPLRQTSTHIKYIGVATCRDGSVKTHFLTAGGGRELDFNLADAMAADRITEYFNRVNRALVDEGERIALYGK